MTADLDSLQQRAAEAERQAAQARAQRQEEQMRRLEDRERREREFAQQYVDGYDAAALATAESEARAAFVAALLDQPWLRRGIEYRAARDLRQQAQREYSNMRTRLGLPAEGMASIGSGETEILPVVAAVVDAEVRARRVAAHAELYERRERHAAGPGE